MNADRRTFFVTTPIYYVTARPHLGSLYSTVLADVAARWNFVQGKETYLLTGTDEHGQKVAQAAEAAGYTPQAFVDKLVSDFQVTWQRYGIHPTHFVRTTSAAHRQAVYAWITAARQTGDVYRDFYEGYYCTPCETFITDRNDDTSQQHGHHDKSGAPLCTSCHRPTVYTKEAAYFFKLSAYADRLLEFYEKHPDFITPRERLHEVVSFVRSGLKDLAISRLRTSVAWGIPFPGDDEHVVYVWVDALMNYISAIGYGDAQRDEDFVKWWPAQVQVLGKDIIRFHAVYWPAFLMAAGLELPHRLLVHGWIKIGGDKMSKSLGNVVDPMILADQYGADVVRYYLVRHVAVTHDAPFSVEDLEVRNNADLADDIGNLVQRIVALAHARQRSKVTTPSEWTSVETALWHELKIVVRNFQEEMNHYMFHRAYTHIWHGISLLNGYVHGQQPWKLSSADSDAFNRIIAAAAHGLSVLGLLIWPVMPEKMERLFDVLGINLLTLRDDFCIDSNICIEGRSRSFIFTLSKPLFPKYVREEEKPVEKPNMQGAVQQSAQQSAAAKDQQQPIHIDDFSKVALVVGTVEEVDMVPKSEKLYKLRVNLGTYGVRTICSGVRAHFTSAELMGKQVLVVANLAPRSMLGIMSEGMILFAEDEQKKLQIVAPLCAVTPGTRLR